MKTILVLLLAVIILLPGCIRHSDNGLHRREQKKESTENVNIRRITPNLMVEDVESTVGFYKRALGFDLVTAFPDTGKMDFAIVSRDNMDIMFQRKNNFIEEFSELQNTPIGGSFSIVVDLKDILVIYEKAVMNGTIIQELHQTPYGTKEFSMKDNNGYILTFSEPLRQ